MKKLLIVCLAIFFMSCGGGDSESPEMEVSPFLFNRWAKGQTIWVCDSRDLPTILNHPKGSVRLELNSDFTYDQYLGGDFDKSGTFQVEGSEINFEPLLPINTEIIRANFVVTLTSLVITYEAEIEMTGRCSIQDRYSVTDD